MEQVIRLAIAEDHEIVRRGIKEIVLSFGGFSVDFEAINGFELFQQLSEAETLPDIIIMDISMPVWDGYETLDAIKKKWPQQKLLILTMHKHELAIIRMFRNGANGYLLKNSNPKELQKALHSIYETGFYFSEIATGNFYFRLQQSNIIPSLSDKELQFLRLCPTDLTYQEIADKMGLTERSLAGHRVNLFEKLGVNSRASLVICAMQIGLITGE